MRVTVARDFVLEKTGEVYLLTPLTDAGKEWVQAICDEPTNTEMWPALEIESDQIEQIIAELYEEGLAFL